MSERESEKVSPPGFATASAGLEDAETDPLEIIEWATATVDRLAVATSFQSSGMVLLHMLRTRKPDIPILFLNTGFHFAETLTFARQIAESWDLKVVELRGKHESAQKQAELLGPSLYRRDPDHCCHINKVEPLQTALEEYDGWISGLRRDQSSERAASVRIAQAQMLPSGRIILKLHPLANWTKEDVDSYVAHHRIPTHPLLEKGFPSIGCWPCTQPVDKDRGPRAGRWSGSDKTECGIHTFGRVIESRETEAEQ